MSESPSGKVALVTGSTSGIGLGIAHCLASKGCSVILTGLIDETLVPKLLAEFKGNTAYKGKFQFIASDFLEVEKVEKFSQDVLALYPDGVDILVNNAGVPGRGLIENLTTKVWQDTLAVNLTAPFVLTRTFFPLMKKRGWGRIINMSSQMGQLGELGKLAYCSSKSALIGFSRVVALEGAQHGVTCNAVCPGFVDAPMCHSFITQVATQQGLSLEDIKNDFLKDGTPIGRLIPISEVAGLVTFLCSDVASSITGSPIAIDGGYAAR
ncbi:3-oxoacyl-[acyl-carrier-protein] reductase FabG [Biomphalaria glabrata]|uniref:3-oxoacyl-[acyl-carrier-protein] reductase n=1 Tax=Biomphalaria glabrata TaxID=6526 RepID=A0A9W2YZ74_BIOGL|nr:D-beta-hydroxybutyrate dehydrogenase-like [Biomphalaria glabrata]KAI8751372.1 3-oxoacyl-[acyl-carrier-protein] reductase FabG-like [Biomphalaria glabrata]